MMTEQDKLLEKLAPLLTETGVTWAVGGSVMLSHKGLEPSPHDVDLLVNPEGFAAADSLLSGLGEKGPLNPHGKYATAHFGQYRIDGMDVDLIAGFAIRHQQGECQYLLRREELGEVRIGGAPVPLCPLEDWYVLYLLMEREHRVTAIESYLKARGADAAILGRWLSQTLPEPVLRRVRALLETL